VAALGNNTVEVLDLNTGRVVHTISDLSEPQSALFVPGSNKIFVTNGGTGVCQIFDGTSFAEIGRVKLSGDADNIRYDSNSSSVIVGYGDGGLSVIDAASGKETTSIKLDGHPESFQLASLVPKAFINMPSANRIVVVDLQQQKVLAMWFMKGTSNFPMGLDETNSRLFVGFRRPAKMVVLDANTGKEITAVDTIGDADDIFYDATHHLIMVIGGEGSIDLFAQKDSNHYEFLNRIPTADGARTGLWVPELSRLYIAVPHRGNQQAEIQVYELQT
jgi:DNA-binding beta-propeller fold protein YncE